MCRRSLCRGDLNKTRARRLLVDGSACASRGVVEDGLRILDAVRVRRESQLGERRHDRR